MYRRIKRIHFVGAGGIGMCGLAELLRDQGYRVSGSDLRSGPTVERLRSLGIEVAIGHDAENVGAADVVVYSSAVRPTNPELLAAEQRHIPVIPRAEMLAEVMRLKDGIAVAGSHGKTTTTSFIAHVLYTAGLDPTAIIGGRVLASGADPTGARLGAGDLLVAEADESDGSFLRLTPVIAVVTNIDPEHLDHYGSFEALQEAFASFANRIPFWGLSVLCFDHPGVQAIVPQMTRRKVTYGFAPQADLVAGAVDPLLQEGDQGLLLHLGVYLGRIDQPPLEGGPESDQALEGEIANQEGRQESPDRGAAEGPGEGGRQRQGKEPAAQDLGSRVIIRFVYHHRHDFTAGAQFGLLHRLLDALLLRGAEKLFCPVVHSGPFGCRPGR